MGNIFHKVLESYARKVEASEYTWFNIPEKEQKRLAAETVEEVSEAYASTLLHSSARNEYVIRRHEADHGTHDLGTDQAGTCRKLYSVQF